MATTIDVDRFLSALKSRVRSLESHNLMQYDRMDSLLTLAKISVLEDVISAAEEAARNADEP